MTVLIHGSECIDGTHGTISVGGVLINVWLTRPEGVVPGCCLGSRQSCRLGQTGDCNDAIYMYVCTCTVNVA